MELKDKVRAKRREVHLGSRESIETPLVSIIVPCRNEASSVAPFTHNLFRQALPYIMEVIVADGMSSDGTHDILLELSHQYPNLRIVQNPGRFTSSGLNVALRAATGEFVVRMDVHTHYAPDYVKNCIDTLVKRNVANAGGPWRARGFGYVGRCIAGVFQSPLVFGGSRNRQLDYEGPVGTVYLGAWRRAHLEALGGYDEKAIRNQDNELNRRVRREGGVIWQTPSIVSEYFVPCSISRFIRQWFQNGYWASRTSIRHPSNMSARHWVCLVALFAALLGVAAMVSGVIPVIVVLGLGAAYLLVVLAASLSLALKTRFNFLLLYPFLIAATQAAWVSGYWIGIVDFGLIRRFWRRPAKFSSLIR